MSEWEKTLISAGVGALLGILSSIAMEYVRPSISRHLMKKNILKHMEEEFRLNYRTLLEAVQIVKEAEGGTPEVKEDARMALNSIRSTILKDRFDYFKTNEKALFYEADEGFRIAKFYVLFEGAVEAYPHQTYLLQVAEEIGKEYIREKGLREVKPLTRYPRTLKELDQATGNTGAAERSVTPKPSTED
jgi:hypothetical protein